MSIIDLPASIADCAPDDPRSRLIMDEVYGRPFPADPQAYAGPLDAESVTWRWPDGAEACWDSYYGWSPPRVPLGLPKLPATIEEAEAEYQILVFFGLPEPEARRELDKHVERIRAKQAERAEAPDQASGDAFMEPRALAERFGLPFDAAFRKRLERWRKAHAMAEGEFFVENPDAVPRQAKYLYSVRHVLPLIRELQDQAKRPANIQRHAR